MRLGNLNLCYRSFQYIRESTNIQQWCYASFQINPADDACRRFDVRSLVKPCICFFGPSFLCSEDRYWLSSGEISPANKEDPELKIKMSANFTLISDTIISKIALLITSWLKMKKIMAWVTLAMEIWTKKIKKQTSDHL